MIVMSFVNFAVISGIIVVIPDHFVVTSDIIAVIIKVILAIFVMIEDWILPT